MFMLMLVTDQQFQQLYYKYIKYAGTVCINTINKYYPGHRSAEEIEDILQESFLNVYIYMSRTDNVRNIKALIAHITRLSTIKLMSKYIKPINTNILPSADEDPTEIALNNINYAELIEYIKKLHPKYSSVILLKNVYGVKLTTIAEITDIPYNTILSWHLRGKKLIAKKLSESNG